MHTDFCWDLPWESARGKGKKGVNEGERWLGPGHPKIYDRSPPLRFLLALYRVQLLLFLTSLRTRLCNGRDMIRRYGDILLFQCATKSSPVKEMYLNKLIIHKKKANLFTVHETDLLREFVVIYWSILRQKTVPHSRRSTVVLNQKSDKWNIGRLCYYVAEPKIPKTLSRVMEDSKTTYLYFSFKISKLLKIVGKLLVPPSITSLAGCCLASWFRRCLSRITRSSVSQISIVTYRHIDVALYSLWHILQEKQRR